MHTTAQADTTQVERVLAKGEAKLKEYAHPDPYIGISNVALHRKPIPMQQQAPVAQQSPSAHMCSPSYEVLHILCLLDVSAGSQRCCASFAGREHADILHKHCPVMIHMGQRVCFE